LSFHQLQRNVSTGNYLPRKAPSWQISWQILELTRQPAISRLESPHRADCYRLTACASSPERLQKVADGVPARKNARPRELKTLTAFIKCQLNNGATDTAVAEIVARLKTTGLSTQPDRKLTLPST
jgi:hypothetical protein